MDSNLPFGHHRSANDLVGETSLNGLSAGELAHTDLISSVILSPALWGYICCF